MRGQLNRAIRNQLDWHWIYDEISQQERKKYRKIWSRARRRQARAEVEAGLNEHLDDSFIDDEFEWPRALFDESEYEEAIGLLAALWLEQDALV